MALNRRIFLQNSLYFFALTLAPKKVWASGATVINSLPAVITTPGDYVLAANHTLNLPHGAAIEVQCNNVTLDLQGYSISNSASGLGTRAVGVYAVDRQEVAVQNGTLIGFHTGVFMRSTGGSSRHLIRDMTLQNQTAAGVIVQGDACVVRNNLIETTLRTTTFSVKGCNSCFMGLGITRSSRTFIYSNSIILHDTPGDLTIGIYVEFSSHDVVVIANNIETSDAGIIVNPYSFDCHIRDTSTTDVDRPITGGIDLGNNT